MNHLCFYVPSSPQSGLWCMVSSSYAPPFLAIVIVILTQRIRSTHAIIHYSRTHTQVDPTHFTQARLHILSPRAWTTSSSLLPIPNFFWLVCNTIYLSTYTQLRYLFSYRIALHNPSLLLQPTVLYTYFRRPFCTPLLHFLALCFVAWEQQRTLLSRSVRTGIREIPIVVFVPGYGPIGRFSGTWIRALPVSTPCASEDPRDQSAYLGLIWANAFGNWRW